MLLCAASVVAAGDGFAPPPQVPRGWTLREVVRMPEKPTRLTSDRAGRLYVLTMYGDVYRLDPDTGAIERAIDRAAYLTRAGEYSCMGLCFDAQDRLYVVANYNDEHARPQQNRVTIFRCDPQDLPHPKPWLETSYPFGIDV